MHIVARAESHSDYCLHHLSDPELLASTRGQVGRSNQILAALLAHLAEVEARGLHRSRACSSLYTYCIYELRMSEDAALRRAHAAKILRRFPVLYEQIAAGEIHLTAVLMLGPHLTEANHVEVLARAKYRTKKEVQALVRQLEPLPDVPACVEPLGPLGRGSSFPISNPNSGKWQASLCGPVRELRPGERPKDWAETCSSNLFGVETAAEQGASGVGAHGDTTAESPGSLAPLRYKVQFTASQEYVELLEQARDLLAHVVPRGALNEIHLRALRLLVAELRKRKYGLTDNPRVPTPRKDKVRKPGGREPARSEAGRVPTESPSELTSTAGELTLTTVDRACRPGETRIAHERAENHAGADRSEAERQRATVDVSVSSEAEREPDEDPSEFLLIAGKLDLTRGQAACGLGETTGAREVVENHGRADRNKRAGNPRWRGRYVPAAVRRAVAERDRERCAYVDDDGRRCRETSSLEFHHLEPRARGGPPTVANLSLRCRGHNGLAAEQDFGREFMSKMQQSSLVTSG